MCNLQVISQHRTRSRSALSLVPATCWSRAAAVAVASISLLGQAAEGPVAAVQRSLKEQQFYYGEVTGQLDEETRAALRRFQIHQGIPVSAEMDTATLQALQSAKSGTNADTQAASDAPAVERSVRGRAQTMVQEDREFLDEIEDGGVAVNAPPPPPAAEKRPSVQEDVQGTPPPPRPAAERNNRPLPDFPGPAEPERQPELEPASINPNEARRFVEDYLAAAEQPTPDEEVSFFTDQVNYFDSGKVNRKFIEKDQRNYYRRWTSREFQLIGQPEILKATDNRATIRFKVRYALSGKRETAEGKTEEIMYLQRSGKDWKISGVRERKLKD